MKRVLAIAAFAIASVVLSACGSSRPIATPVAAHYRGTGSLTFVATSPSTELGVDNADLFSATPGGLVHDVTSTAAAESEASWSADGRHVVFIRQWTTGHENGHIAVHSGVFVWEAGHGAPRRIASCSDACTQGDFAWSPNDRQIAFVSGARTYGAGDAAIEVMNADGSDLHSVCDQTRCGSGLAAPRWSPDARRLVFSNERAEPFDLGGIPPSPIWIANADGSGLERLTQPNCNAGNRHPQGCAFDTSPAWSPSGRLIAFIHHQAYGAPTIATSVEVMRVDGSHQRRLYRCAGESCNQTLPLAWAPDGKSIAFGPVTAHDSSVRLTTLAGKTTTIRTCSGSRCLHPEELAWSPNDKQLAFIAGGGVWLIGRNGEAMHRVAAGGQCCLAWVRKVLRSSAKALPKLAPGRHLHLSGSIVYGTALNDLRPFNLLSFGAAGTPAARLAKLQGKEPTFSPDGREIAFTGTVATDYVWHVLVADRNGKNVRVLTDLSATDPAWSPDGRTIAFTRDPGGGTRHWIGLVSVTGGPIRDVTSAGLRPSWSPSGDELVFQRSVAGGEALFTVRPDGHGLRRLTKLPGEQGSPAWSPDGKEIAFEWFTPAGTGLYLIRPNGTHLRRVTTANVPTGKPA